MSCAGTASPISFLGLLFFVSLAQAFSFAYGPPTQCDPFTVSWTGGTAPFSVLLTPVFDNPRNFSIPSSSISGSSGNYSLPRLPLSAGQQFVVSMSDAAGFGTGGVSDILTVGSSVSKASCSTQIPTPSFQFELNSQLQQCAPYNISGYTGATQPVTITGLIPLGKPFQLLPTAGPSWYVWDPANVPAGTNIMFFLTGSAGNFGGSSHVMQVGGSGDSGCINGQSPMSTANSASGGPTATGDSPSTVNTPASTSAPGATVTVASKGATPAVIGGAVAAGLVALLVLGTLAAFFFRKYLPQKTSNRLSQNFSPGGSRHQGRMPSVDLLQPNSANPLNRSQLSRYDAQDAVPSHWTSFPNTPGTEYLAEPWSAPSTGRGNFSSAAATENGWHDSRSDVASPMPMQPSPAHTGHAPKSAMGPPSHRPTRFILHTDVEEEIELPPHYTDWSERNKPHPPPP